MHIRSYKSFLCHICRTKVCWDPKILLPLQRAVWSRRNEFSSLLPQNKFLNAPYSPKCFSEAACVCAAKENNPVLKKWNSSTFLLHAKSMCKAASPLMFLAGLLVAVGPGTVLSLSPVVCNSLILTRPLSVFSKDDFKKSILSSTRTTLLESPCIQKRKKSPHWDSDERITTKVFANTALKKMIFGSG